MDYIGIPTFRPSALGFSTYSTEEMQALSVKEVVNPQTFDNLLHPTIGGLYDPAFGPTEKDDICMTCGQNYIFCPGHMGHIQLPLPVYNPVHFQIMLKILRGTCFQCHRVLAPAAMCHLLVHQLKALELGCLPGVGHLRDLLSEVLADHGSKNCEEIIQNKLNQYTESLKEQNPLFESAKNVVELKRQLIKDFLANFFVGRGKCPHCKMSIRTIRAEHSSKICIFSRTKEQRQVAVADARRKALEKIKQQQQNSEDAEAVNMDESLTNTREQDLDADIQKASGQTYLTAVEARTHLREVWKIDASILKSLFGTLGKNNAENPMDIFFMEVVPVAASRFRPISVMRDRRFENGQTSNLARVVADTVALRHIFAEIKRQSLEDQTTTEEVRASSVDEVPGGNMTEKLQNTWVRLQTHVNCVVDSDLDKLSTDKQPGIKQILEKKEGLFRKHMMGKRVDYAARSVISPDPCINTNEIGIPIVFASKLTYPEPVTPWNVHELRQAVINGPLVHPGAVFVMNEDGSKTMLSATNKTQREALAKQLLTRSSRVRGPVMGNKKVYRHLRNGDVLLLNRQPTLHRPSIQAHIARVLPGERTLRMHYANCKAYNADFDGDEMNAHFPQNEFCRSEAYSIASTDSNYLVPKDGSPLAGLIQDHMVSGVSLTVRGRFFNRRDYQQLVYSSLVDVQGRVKLFPPTIIKPHRLWAGKQIISTILANIIPEGKQPLNLTGKAKIPEKSWVLSRASGFAAGGLYPSGDELGEGVVLFRDGELLRGVLDKGHYGNTPYSLVHACYELYGGPVSGKLLTCLGRLFMAFLQYRGFTLGVEDILVTDEADEERQKIISESRQCGPSTAREAFGLSEDADEPTITSSYQGAHLCGIDTQLAELDLSVKGKTDQTQNLITKVCMPYGLHKNFPHNNLQLMVQSGAKGSTVNTMQISCLLGQIELEGRRPPLMISGKSLPSFLPYDSSPRAGGFVDGRFLTGIRPQEYFFHCMAGREGLIDTAVKTSRSGYLQRCLIKHLEGLIVSYDMTVRDSDGSIVQFYYGEDGLDIMKTPYLNEKQFHFLVENRLSKHGGLQERLFDKFGADVSVDLYREVETWQRQRKVFQEHTRTSGFLTFCRKKGCGLVTEDSQHTLGENGRTVASKTLTDAWRLVDEKRKKKYSRSGLGCPDPIMSKLSPQCAIGVMSETMAMTIDNYCAADADKQFPETEPHGGKHMEKLTEEDFWRLISLKYQQSLVEPGEAVGLLAAQSIGEPSTQMTLNTFHFAGRGEMNVTLGIPRLREILMVASSNIKTPALEIPVFPGPKAKNKAKLLQTKLNRIYVKEVLQDVSVCECLHVKSRGDCGRLYTIKFQFLPLMSYKDRFAITPKQILRYIEYFYIKHLVDIAKKKMSEFSSSRLLSSGTVVRQQRETATTTANPSNQDEENDSEIEQEEDDAVSRKALERADDSGEYRGEEEERAEMGDNQSGDEDQELDPSLLQEGEEDGEGTESVLPSTVLVTAKRKRRSSAVMNQERITAVKHTTSHVTEYKYDADDELWCKVTLRFGLVNTKLDLTSLIEQDAGKMIIHQVPGISRCFLAESKGNILLKTEGVNIMAMYQYGDVLDLNKLYSNDIHAIASVYGIEAAAKVLIKEIKGVFGAYGIQVDYRHLSLVADYMTFEGTYKPFNRLAMESNASPLQKMSFETTMSFIKSAALHGSKDLLLSPSARLVTGRVVGVGTGAFEVVQPLF